MNQHPLLAPLNEAQRAAVAAAPGPVLVLAGAGSGKTRVLTHRAAWLILEHGLAPQSLLAVTFTNKAAAEMRGRIETLLGIPGSALWIGTFHGIAHRLLRRHWREAGLPQTFQIQDEDDQQRLVRRIIREQQLDEQRWAPREVTGFINRQKDEGRRPQQLEDRGDPTRRQLIRLYELYQRRCNQQGLVDFAELLLRTFEMLRDRAELGAHYREPLPAPAGGRVPGHQRDPVPVAAAAGHRRERAVRRRRRRPVHLPLARRAGREHAAVPPRLRGTRCSGSSRTTGRPR